ncbi:hypothetical protein KFE25_007311 [Diacronema lutheri]|uniref:Dynein intermediate chain n=3 Tax=Diacronema lutheri TaxID=2081491 RepID=A0A8J5XP14_DIALT|nr:hypothetical protein KFE25_007311 [Diacronema lutheri]
MEIVYVYQKSRREFGRPTTQFIDRPAELLDEFAPDPSIKDTQYELRNPTHLDVQAIPEMSEHDVNTESFSYASVGMLHAEGGWPKDIDWAEKDQTARFRKKVEKDEEYIREVKALADVVEHHIKQNNAIDIYEEYFTGEHADHSSEAPSAKTLSVFKDPNPVKRTVSSLSFHPDGGRKIAVAFSLLQFQDERADSASNQSYIWAVDNPNQPELEINPQSKLVCLEYNSKDAFLLAGGCYNGLISYWDTRRGSEPVESSLIEKSHRDPVYSIVWLQGKTAYECASTSTDGQVLWWDIRKLGEPTESLELISGDVTMGGVSLEYSAAGGPTKFMVGTEQGTILMCNRKGKSAQDKIGTVYSGHHGPTYALQRNPFFPKYFLSIGDWRHMLWSEELRTPIMTSAYHSAYLLSACWSPTRPAVFFSSKMDGTLDIWDLFYKVNEPTLTLQVDDDGLQAVRVQEGGVILATGSVDGSVYLMELCNSLAVQQPQEKQSMQQMLDREFKKEKNLEARAKELAKKAAKESEAQRDPTALQPTDEALKAVEQEFYDTIAEYEQKELEANRKD